MYFITNYIERILKCYYKSDKCLYKLFDPHFAILVATCHRIWSKGGNVMFAKSKQTLTR